ncbi:energy-coupling factor transporter transmembrane component T family protein [Desulfosporosinus meridiei]|uniref:ABC-type cobalt transport system, permease component CbiQ n=1 Tax=Desulfosporosinus meridiei (strain ATCC BAA-275 / DSM 13257 / KCTC 12902 / NCIMB 13706 / S10) TaxID=768704 RepID=J7IVK0_DESMD|nr:energy-coupling factor transporter transmembrane component T [Desulfosporosinus meridiei]AFQ43153.1 ABC-type cobalt transport system, permease component CbiQ [Desulfosporosinus meridiei DSM 13257]
MLRPGYAYRESPVHDRDPRVKLIAVIALSIIIFKVNFFGLLVVSMITLVISLLGRLSLRSVLKTVYPVLPFFILLFLMYIFFTPGRPIPPFPIGLLQISYEGLNLGILQIWKFLLLVVAAAILTMTTSQSGITMGLERLLRPVRIVGISSHDIAMLISLALRFMPTLLDEMNSISQAQLSRGANFNPRRLSGKIRAIGYLAIPLAVNVFRRCDELVDAMEARGYQPGHRTYLHELALSRLDYWLIVGIIAALVLVVIV